MGIRSVNFEDLRSFQLIEMILGLLNFAVLTHYEDVLQQRRLQYQISNQYRDANKRITSLIFSESNFSFWYYTNSEAPFLALFCIKIQTSDSYFHSKTNMTELKVSRHLSLRILRSDLNRTRNKFLYCRSFQICLVVSYGHFALLKCATMCWKFHYSTDPWGQVWNRTLSYWEEGLLINVSGKPRRPHLPLLVNYTLVFSRHS